MSDPDSALARRTHPGLDHPPPRGVRDYQRLTDHHEATGPLEHDPHHQPTPHQISSGTGSEPRDGIRPMTVKSETNGYKPGPVKTDESGGKHEKK